MLGWNIKQTKRTRKSGRNDFFFLCEIYSNKWIIDISLTNIPINAIVGVKFTMPGTPLNPNANAREIQLKHNPNADACNFVH